VTDLYAILGVPRDADRATIRRAYRDKARRTHPDSGGSSQEFEQVKAAYDTLIDEVRRRRYDETGEVPGAQVDRHRIQLMEILSVGLDLAMHKLSRRARPPKHADMVWLTSEALRQRRQEWIGQHREIEKAAERSRELLGRFSSASADNLMEAVVARRVETCQKELATFDERIKLVDEALEMLNRMTFRVADEPDPLRDPEWASKVEMALRYKYAR
jgi:curved DNA-binding protein CbpA